MAPTESAQSIVEASRRVGHCRRTESFDCVESERQIRGVVISEVIEKLQSLSPERAEKVVSLIDDLAEIEAQENAEDLKEAREVLADPGECVTLDELDKRRAQ